MFLNGTAMAGGADHHLVGDAALVAATTTAPRYRFHAVDDRYPALEDVGERGGAVEGEVYEMSYEQLREVLLPGEPAGPGAGRDRAGRRHGLAGDGAAPRQAELPTDRHQRAGQLATPYRGTTRCTCVGARR